jgi:tetrahydromethanopterin S-methyltransferase subunit B
MENKKLKSYNVIDMKKVAADELEARNYPFIKIRELEKRIEKLETFNENLLRSLRYTTL